MEIGDFIKVPRAHPAFEVVTTDSDVQTDPNYAYGVVMGPPEDGEVCVCFPGFRYGHSGLSPAARTDCWFLQVSGTERADFV